MSQTRNRAAFVGCLLLSTACAMPSRGSVTNAARPPAALEPVVVFVTRHAEKGTNDPRDPDLSEAGKQRADALAAMLARAGVTHLFATELKRTQQTLAPLSKQCGAAVTVVPVADSAKLADALLALPAGSVAVIAGHSNTVPALVRRLGGTIERTTTTDRGEMLPDEEYGRVMMLVLPPPTATDRKAERTLELHAGAP